MDMGRAFYIFQKPPCLGQQAGQQFDKTGKLWTNEINDNNLNVFSWNNTASVGLKFVQPVFSDTAVILYIVLRQSQENWSKCGYLKTRKNPPTFKSIKPNEWFSRKSYWVTTLSS